MGLTRNLEIIRDILARELETVSTYQRWAEEVDNEELKRMIGHIRDEEKEHIAECYKYLSLHDATQDHANEEVDEEHFPNGVFVATPAGEASPEAEENKSLSPDSLTVGSLK
ncbi:MAG: ferritin-like domain-containing protein [Firmicutes bacterium]|nr:ferritin-like domain-containing protein [Bacillota bacterium]